MQEAFISRVLLPLTEKSGEVERVEELLSMLEHCFIDTFKISTSSEKREANFLIDTDGVSSTFFASAPSSLDAGEEAKLLVVRAVANFHRNGAVRLGSFFRAQDYHSHAALFILELLKSLSGNSKHWFRQLQLDSLDACLAIVEVIGTENVRLCLPGVVSVAVRYIHRAHHGKDSTKVCLAAVKLLCTALGTSFATAEPVTWVRDTAVHLATALRSILDPSALVGSAFAPVTVAALRSLIVSLLSSSAMAECATTPLSSLLIVAYSILENMDHLHHLGDDVFGVAEATSSVAFNPSHLCSSTDDALMTTLMGSSWAILAVTEALQCLRGIELLHLATTVARLPGLRDHFFPLQAPPQAMTSTAASPDVSESTVAIFLSVVRKCVRVVGTEMSESALYTHRRPRKYPAGVVDEFLFCLAGALARLPTAGALTPDRCDFQSDETIGECLTNALLSEYDAVLQDWDAYAVHPAVLYVLSRLVVWQFHPAQALHSLPTHPISSPAGVVAPDNEVAWPCTYPQPADLTAGAFEQLWSIVAQPHLWAITQDEELCTYQQVHHRQVVAATLLRVLALIAEVLQCGDGSTSEEPNTDQGDALERFFALTLYLVLEKATASGLVHEVALHCVEVYSAASGERDTLLFLLRHSALIVDETARAVREEHLRPSAASVLRGSLALLERRFTRDGGGGSSDHAILGASGSANLTALVRQRLSVTAMSANFTRSFPEVVSLEEAAQVADFVASTIHVAREALRLCGRYDSTDPAEDVIARRAALSLLRDALDLAAYLNYCVPQDPMDEEQERLTTSAHIRVRALQSVVLEAVYAVLCHCTRHDQVAAMAVQTVVRGLTCFLTTTASLTWADVTRRRLIDEAAERRRRGGPKTRSMAKEEEADITSEDGDEYAADFGRTPLPTPSPMDWPWTHYTSTAAGSTSAATTIAIELPRSHLHTIYRVYLFLFALLREPIAAFETHATKPHAWTGMERRRLGDVTIAPALFETLSGLEAIRLLAFDFLVHRTVEEVLPLVLLWHERARLSRIPTHTEERAMLATRQFVEHLYGDCKDSADLQGGEGMSVKPVVPLPPQPCLIAADESVNPLPKLLLSFPVPRLVSQLRLEMGCARLEEEETPDTGLRIESPASSWQVEELDHVSQGMQESAQQLFLTGAFSHFFQEQFHHEVGPPLRERCGGAGDGDAAHRSQGRGYAALWVSHKVSSGIQGLFSCNAHQTTLPSASRLRRQGEAATTLSSSVPTGKDASRHRVPLTRVPDSESWVAGEDAAAVSFRSRRSTESGSVLADLSTDSRSSVPAAGASSIPASGRRRASATVASTSTTSSTAVNYKPRTAPESAHLESLGMSLSATDESANAKSISFAEFVRQACSDDESGVVTCNVPLLLGYVSWLPLQVRPFDGIPSEQMTACLTTLAASGTGAEEAAAGSSCNSGLHGSLWSVRMWLCCQCLAHPHFPTEAAPVELVGRAVDAFARVIRHVAALLSQAQQSADAAAAEGNTVAGTTHVWHPSSALGRGSGVADELTTSSLFPWLEQLRGYLRSFAVMLYNRTVQLVPATDVYRLEELCYQCLFYVTRSCSEKMHLLYGTYITDSAVHLYQCIWNRLQMGRQRSVEMFFQRLPLSSAGLMHRSYRVNYYERAVLPLTVAMLSGAQSLVISGEVSESVTVETLQRQCNLWTSAFVHDLLLGRCVGEGGRVGDTAAVRVAEDLVDLLGLPEWPGADMLLHAFVRALAQLCLGAESATATATAAAAEALRLLAVDVVAHVALKLFDEKQSSLPISILAEVERLRESSASSQLATRVRLQQVLRVPAPAHPAPDDQQAWERMCGAPGKAAASNPDAADLALLGMMVSVYMAESQLISNPSTTADFAAVWLHVRAAQLTTWAALQDNDQRWLSQAALATLVRWQRPPGVGDAPVNWTDVCAWTQAISTQLRNSMLNLRTRHTLVSLLLSISRFTDAQEVAVPVSDAVQKRTLAYLARLGAVYPPLHRHLWPVARQCVQDDSARVRESIVPLLVTILNAATVTATEGELSAATDYYVATADGVTAEVVSSLLCLLGDKSAAVVSRTIAALSTFLTDDAHQGLLVTPHGAPLLSFIQQKLLQLAAPDDMEAQRHQEEVVKHFLRRWVVALGDTVGSLTGADAQLAKELVALAVMGAPDYPHDLSEDHPLVRLLRDMHAYVAAYDSAGETPSSTANAPTAAAVRRRPRGNHIDRARLLHVMRCAARSLWTRYTCFHSVEDAVSSLAALRALAQAHSEWVQPLAEVLVQSITYPPPSTSPLAKAPDALGGALVHMCQTLHAVLKAPRLPLVSLDQLARCLTVLLSKYVGPYQQRVIVASCSALCALITCGAKHPFSAQVNVPYLQLCYSLMNTYYTRVRGLLPNLATQPQSVAYTQRFLFLLSEFLRMYPGWKQHPPHPALEEESLMSHEKGVAGPNALISGSGIMANVYQLLEDVLGSCGSAAAQKGVAVIALRVMASLCLLDPATYFFRAQGHIRDALRSHDINLQLQGLSLLSDFLKEEDKRVEMAARQATRLNTTALILGSNSGDGGGNSSDTSSGSQGNNSRCDAPLPSGRVKRTRRRRAATADVQKQMRAGANARRGPPAHFSAAGHTEDFNSGMSTWVFQHFHGDIARLSCGTPSSQVRALSLRLFQQAAHGGLLPPDKYMQAIVALAADVHAPLRQQAGSILAVHSERHEEVVGMSIGRGVVLAYRLHHICDMNLLFSAVVPEKPLSAAPGVESEAGDVLNGYSVHSTVYALLHKRLRDSMITTLVRFFYDDGRVRSWCEEHVQLLADASKTLAASSSSGDIFHLFHPLSFLCHMTLALATLPFQHESDVMQVLKQARNGLDLCGQEALDWLMDGEVSGTLPLCTDVSASTLMQWKAIGAVLLHYLRRSLKLEYRLSSAKLTHCPNRQNHRAANRGAPHYTLSQLPRNATHTAARADLIARIERLVHILDPALRGIATSHSSADVVGRGWHALGVELQAALLEESGDEFRRASPLLCSPGVHEKDKTNPAAHARRKPAGPQKRKRQRSSSSSDTTREDAGVEHEASYDETSASSLSQSSTTEDIS